MFRHLNHIIHLNISAYTSNSELSSRLEELSASHRSRHSAHSRLIDGLDDSHGRLKQRLDEVHGKLG